MGGFWRRFGKGQMCVVLLHLCDARWLLELPSRAVLSTSQPSVAVPAHVASFLGCHNKMYIFKDTSPTSLCNPDFCKALPSSCSEHSRLVSPLAPALRCVHLL